MNGILGVLGGMGPAATADFLAKLVAVTPAETDQDHLPVIAQSMPNIPDRSHAILGAGPSPLPALRAGLTRLKAAGATLAVMPCNTAHHWFEPLAREMSMLHIVDAVQATLTRHGIARGPIGLLATSGTVAAGIYPKRLADTGFDVLVPAPDEQAALVEASIRAIKAGRPGSARGALVAALDGLKARGARATVLGCTELPLALPPGEAGNHLLVDSTAALAEACVAALCGTDIDRAA